MFHACSRGEVSARLLIGSALAMGNLSLEGISPAQLQDARDIVSCRVRLQLIKKPQPLLRKRKRQHTRARNQNQRQCIETLSIASRRIHPFSERGYRRCFKQRA